MLRALDGLTAAQLATASALSELLTRTTRMENTMADHLTALTAEVARNSDVDASAIILLNGLATQIASLKNDPAALQALADQIKGSSDKLAEAVTANTPAA